MPADKDNRLRQDSGLMQTQQTPPHQNDLSLLLIFIYHLRIYIRLFITNARLLL